jgi:hypothetical protein
MFPLAVLHNPSGNTSLKFRYAHFDEKPGDFWFIQQAVNLHVPIPNAVDTRAILNQASVARYQMPSQFMKNLEGICPQAFGTLSTFAGKTPYVAIADCMGVSTREPLLE